jgi:hypothetical protein
MEDKQTLQQKLRELERTREQAFEQVSRAHGNLREELKALVITLDGEIAELRGQIADA